MNSASENSVITRLRRGNKNALEELFRLHYQSLCLYAFKYVKDNALAEDMVQEVFYQLWKKREDINIQFSIQAYLFQSVQNNCLMHIRKQNLDKKYKKFESAGDSQDFNDASTALIQSEIVQIINKTFESLPEKSRTIFRLSRVKGLKYREIAEELSLSVKTVEARMTEVLKAFRKNLKEYAAQ